MKKFKFLIIFSVMLIVLTGFNAFAKSENKMTYKMNLMEDAMYVDVKIETEHTSFKFAIDVPKGAEVYDVEGKSLRDSFESGTKYIFQRHLKGQMVLSLDYTELLTRTSTPLT